MNYIFVILAIYFQAQSSSGANCVGLPPECAGHRGNIQSCERVEGCQWVPDPTPLPADFEYVTGCCHPQNGYHENWCNHLSAHACINTIEGKQRCEWGQLKDKTNVLNKIFTHGDMMFEINGRRKIWNKQQIKNANNKFMESKPKDLQQKTRVTDEYRLFDKCGNHYNLKFQKDFLQTYKQEYTYIQTEYSQNNVEKTDRKKPPHGKVSLFTENHDGIKQYGFCSGTMLSGNIVITATHCVGHPDTEIVIQKEPIIKKDTSNTYADVNKLRFASGAIEDGTINSRLDSPAWKAVDWVLASRERTNDADWALIHLEEPIDDYSTRRFGLQKTYRRDISKPMQYQYIGYKASAYIPRTVEIPFTRMLSKWKFMSQQNGQHLVVGSGGMSGSGLLIKKDDIDTNILIGVYNSAVEQERAVGVNELETFFTVINHYRFQLICSVVPDDMCSGPTGPLTDILLSHELQQQLELIHHVQSLNHGSGCYCANYNTDNDEFCLVDNIYYSFLSKNAVKLHAKCPTVAGHQMKENLLYTKNPHLVTLKRMCHINLNDKIARTIARKYIVATRYDVRTNELFLAKISYYNQLGDDVFIDDVSNDGEYIYNDEQNLGLYDNNNMNKINSIMILFLCIVIVCCCGFICFVINLLVCYVSYAFGSKYICNNNILSEV